MLMIYLHDRKPTNAIMGTPMAGKRQCEWRQTATPAWGSLRVQRKVLLFQPMNRLLRYAWTMRHRRGAIFRRLFTPPSNGFRLRVKRRMGKVHHGADFFWRSVIYVNKQPWTIRCQSHFALPYHLTSAKIALSAKIDKLFLHFSTSIFYSWQFSNSERTTWPICQRHFVGAPSLSTASCALCHIRACAVEGDGTPTSPFLHITYCGKKLKQNDNVTPAKYCNDEDARRKLLIVLIFSGLSRPNTHVFCAAPSFTAKSPFFGCFCKRLITCTLEKTRF